MNSQLLVAVICSLGLGLGSVCYAESTEATESQEHAVTLKTKDNETVTCKLSKKDAEKLKEGKVVELLVPIPTL